VSDVVKGLVKSSVQWELDNINLNNKSWFCTGVLFPFCVNVSLTFVELFLSSFSPLEMCSSC